MEVELAAADSGEAVAFGGPGLDAGSGSAGCPTCDFGCDPPVPGEEPEPVTRHTDPMRPPSVPTDASCLHCQRVVSTATMRWEPESAASRARRLEREAAEAGLVCSTCGWTPPPPHPADEHGRWLCGTPGCDGAGFGFDLHPIEEGYTDPDGRDLGEWASFDEEEDDDEQPF